MSSDSLSAFAKRVEPAHSWNDVTLPEDAIAQLRRIPAEFAKSRVSLGDRGPIRQSSRKGVAVLFTGPSGTGKLLAAEAIAGDLKVDVVRIDLKAVVSTYIGETEKNLNAIFSEMTNTDAILFFDEADALFGRRSDVKDDHDRYQNLAIDYLLQRIEDYPSIVILASNLQQNTDDAFIRRMRFVVDFASENARD